MIRFFELSSKDLDSQIQNMGLPRYRASQILNWVYQKGICDYDQMTNIAKADQDLLRSRLVFILPELVNRFHSQRDGTQRFLFRLDDGEMIESVLLIHEKRRTVCISSQVGCALGCKFCATGRLGFKRNLHLSEIIAQVWLVQQISGEKVQNVVFMGMGEPLMNYDPVVQAIRHLNDPRMFNLSIRRITLSTVGVLPQMERLAQENLDICLSVSLHAPSNPIRDQLIPYNTHMTIEELVQGIARYIDQTQRRVTIEYILIKEINDQEEHAQQLAQLLKGLKVNINVIPLNPVDHFPHAPADPHRVQSFTDLLRGYGYEVVLRQEKGQDVQAACGQLRGRYS